MGPCPHDGTSRREDCVRCLRQDRDGWKERAENAEKEVEELDAELDRATWEVEREADEKGERLRVVTAELAEAVWAWMRDPLAAHAAQRADTALAAAEEELR